MSVIYDYDELGRPIVSDMYRDDDGVLRYRRTYPVNVRCHDWGLGSERGRPKSHREYRMITILRAIYRWGRYYGLPSYVIDTAALYARRLDGLYVRSEAYDTLAVALLKIAARKFGLRFRAREHRKGLLKMMRKVMQLDGFSRGY